MHGHITCIMKIASGDSLQRLISCSPMDYRSPYVTASTGSYPVVVEVKLHALSAVYDLCMKDVGPHVWYSRSMHQNM